MDGPSIIEIENPKENSITVKTKSVLISRMHNKKPDEYKIALIRLFEENNPHKKNIFPTRVYRFTNIEKVRIRNMTLSYYLEGNDLVLNDLQEIHIQKEDCKIILTAQQDKIERRIPEKE